MSPGGMPVAQKNPGAIKIIPGLIIRKSCQKYEISDR